ncbi:MAG TPA: hypothetical protein VE466_15190, partial [Acidimicrobiales bacterium]|nr:hypothetical protein [Acidimicrobiales bacterium]
MTEAGDRVPALPETARVVNIGLPLFADAVARQGFEVVNVDWRIPAGGDPEVVAALARLYGPKGAVIDAANAEVLRRLDSGAPKAIRVRPGAEVVPGLEGMSLLHCGPRIDYADAIDPLRRSMRAAVVAEGWSDDLADADRLLANGRVALEPANHHDACVPMVTAIGPSQPLWVV